MPFLCGRRSHSNPKHGVRGSAMESGGSVLACSLPVSVLWNESHAENAERSGKDDGVAPFLYKA